MDVENEKKTKYKDYILRVMPKVCKKITYPKKNDYVKAIAELKAKDDKLQQPYAAEEIRSGISKAIDKLVNDDEFLCMYNEAGKAYYVPNRGKYKQRYFKDKIYENIKDKVKVVDKDILIVSYNVCAIKVEAIGDVNIKDLFRKSLEDKCFHILKNQTLLYIMLKERNDRFEIPNEKCDEYLIIKGLGGAIRKLYDIQNNIPPKNAKQKLPKKQQ